MSATPLATSFLVLIKPKICGDEGGFFFERSKLAKFEAAKGWSVEFRQSETRLNYLLFLKRDWIAKNSKLAALSLKRKMTLIETHTSEIDGLKSELAIDERSISGGQNL